MRGFSYACQIKSYQIYMKGAFFLPITYLFSLSCGIVTGFVASQLSLVTYSFIKHFKSLENSSLSLTILNFAVSYLVQIKAH